MSYDAIIVGGGHNGLVCGAILAQAGKKVLVLERRPVLGGAAATEEIFPRCSVNTGAHDAGLFLPEIIEQLNLDSQGLQVYQTDVAVFAPQPDGTAITLWRDMERTIRELAVLYPQDAEQFPKFNALMNRLSQTLRPTLMRTPPQVGKLEPTDVMAWLKPLVRLKKLGRRDMAEFLRVLPMPVSEFLDEWFESEALKGLLAASAVSGGLSGPMAAGTAFSLLYHYTGRENGGFRSSWFIRGGTGRLSEVLAEFIQKHGGQVRTEATVKQIFVNDNDEAVGVRVNSGEKLFAKVIVSNADPRRTFFQLVGPTFFEPRFVRKVKNIRYRGGMAKLNLVLKGLPTFTAASGDPQQLGGHIVICPSVKYLERAADDAKYGRFSAQPVLDIVIPTITDTTLAPPERHLMSINMLYAPFHLAAGDWEQQRAALRTSILSTLAAYAPDLPERIEQEQLLTPLDWEQKYGLTEGNPFHGEMALDQLLFMRPVPGWGRYQTPVKGLFLCGAGTHPGGGVTGAPGYNAAREVLRALKSR